MTNIVFELSKMLTYLLFEWYRYMSLVYTPAVNLSRYSVFIYSRPDLERAYHNARTNLFTNVIPVDFTTTKFHDSWYKTYNCYIDTIDEILRFESKEDMAVFLLTWA